jgi:hypothetical protein
MQRLDLLHLGQRAHLGEHVSAQMIFMRDIYATLGNKLFCRLKIG